MKHKYISQDKKTNVWKISNAKAGKSIKNFDSKEKAIDYLQLMSDVVSYEIKINEIWKIYALIKKNQKKTTNSVSKKTTTKKITLTQSSFKKPLVKSLATKKKSSLSKKTTTKKITPIKSSPKKPLVKSLAAKKKSPLSKKTTIKKITPIKSSPKKPLAKSQTINKKHESQEKKTVKKIPVQQVSIQPALKKISIKKIDDKKEKPAILITKQKDDEIKKNIEKVNDLKAISTKSYVSKKNLSFLLPIVGIIIINLLILLMILWYKFNW